MKRIALLSTIFVLLASITTAQIDRTKKPLAGPPPKASFPDYTETKLKNGLKVFVVENHEEPLITFRLMFKTGSEFDGKKSGLSNFMCDLLTKGTKKRTANEFAKESDFIGAGIGASAADDNMSMSGGGLKKYSDKILELMTDALFNPIFPEEELEKARKQALSGLVYAKADPNSLAGNLEIKVVYNKHPYSNFETEKSLKAVTRDDLVKFHQAHLIPNNASLAVVGDVTSKEIIPVIEKYFGSWKSGVVQVSKFPEPDPVKGVTVHIVDRPGAVQSNIAVAATGMKRKNNDYIHLSVVNSIFGGGFSGRLFQNLREKHGFTYGAYSSIDARKMAGAFSASADVRRIATDSAITEIINEMKRLHTEEISDKDLSMHKDYLSGTYLLSLESAGTTASRVQSIDLYGLDKDYYKNYVMNVRSITSKEAKDLATKYIPTENIVILVVGDAKELKPKLEKFGTVTVYDTDIEPVSAKPTSSVDITIDQLIEKHIEALGGRAALEGMKDRTTEGTVTINAGGQKMEGTILEIEKAPNKSYKKMALPMFTQETWCDGEHVIQAMGPQTMNLEGDELKQALEETQFNDIIRFNELGIKAVVKDKKEVNGKMAYAMEVTKKSGKVEARFIDAQSFLLVKDAKSMDTPRGSMTIETTYGDYKPVQGIMLPHSVMPNMMGVPLEVKVSSYKLNSNVADSVFVKK